MSASGSASAPSVFDAEDAVLAHQRAAGALAVDAHENRRRRIGDGAHRGRRKAGLAGRTRGRHHVHGGAEPAHRLAKQLGVDSRDMIGTDRLEGAGHRVVGTLVDPAHGDDSNIAARRATVIGRAVRFANSD
jgi:hypothetical protein